MEDVLTKLIQGKLRNAIVAYEDDDGEAILHHVGKRRNPEKFYSDLALNMVLLAKEQLILQKEKNEPGG